MVPYELHKVFLKHTFDLGFTKINWIFPYYTLMMFIGMVVGLYLYNRSSNIPIYTNIKIIFICTIATMIGGRFFYLIFYKTPTPWYMIFINMFTIWKVGMVSVGGFPFCILALYFSLKHYKIDFLNTLDKLAPSISIGLFFVRIGCFLAGCCYGITTTVPWAIDRFGKLVHPTQIYSSFYNLVIFTFLYYKSKQPYKKGEIFAWWLILYGIARFLVEIIRVNPDIIFGLSNQQLFNIVMVIVGILLLYLPKKSHKSK